jgi:hypothetical protein
MPFETSRPSTSQLGEKLSLGRRAKVMVIGKFGWLPPLLDKTIAEVSQPTSGPRLALGSSLSHGRTSQMPPAKVGSVAHSTGAANYRSYRSATVAGSIRGKIAEYPFLHSVHIRKTGCLPIMETVWDKIIAKLSNCLLSTPSCSQSTSGRLGVNP